MTIQEGQALEGISEAQSTTQFVSSTIYTDQRAILRARILFSTTRIPNGSSVYLSNDGGDSWELATWGEWHIFTSTGTELCYRIVGVVGSILAIESAYNHSNPIKVEYVAS